MASGSAAPHLDLTSVEKAQKLARFARVRHRIGNFHHFFHDYSPAACPCWKTPVGLWLSAVCRPAYRLAMGPGHPSRGGPCSMHNLFCFFESFHLKAMPV